MCSRLECRVYNGMNSYSLKRFLLCSDGAMRVPLHTRSAFAVPSRELSTGRAISNLIPRQLNIDCSSTVLCEQAPCSCQWASLFFEEKGSEKRIDKANNKRRNIRQTGSRTETKRWRKGNAEACHTQTRHSLSPISSSYLRRHILSSLPWSFPVLWRTLTAKQKLRLRQIPAHNMKIPWAN